MSDLYLLDDHTLLRDGLRAVLQAAGHRVVGESADPTQALAELRDLGPVTVLLDLHLGVRSGFELLTELQRRALDVRVIVDAKQVTDVTFRDNGPATGTTYSVVIDGRVYSARVGSNQLIYLDSDAANLSVGVDAYTWTSTAAAPPSGTPSATPPARPTSATPGTSPSSTTPGTARTSR